jgi:signal peptidase I
MARKPKRSNSPKKRGDKDTSKANSNAAAPEPSQSSSEDQASAEEVVETKSPPSDASGKDQPKLTRAQKRADQIRTSGYRETVEAFVVAFILALLFRAFIAEAFVIPTGSMAPTLMGAHKDLTCAQCEQQFQVGASKERRGPRANDSVVAGICPNCRYLNNLDLAGNPNHGTFNGDRILVSKFAYTLNEPERFDVIVFKFPGNPKQNYIKRLVGLPNERLSIQYGDVYTAPLDGSSEAEILRKPADKLLAMRHHVYDSDKQAPVLIDAEYPSRLQPWRPGSDSPPDDSWQIERFGNGMVASVGAADDQEHWLRYFHRWPTDQQWDIAASGGKLNDVDPYSSRLITDFYAYDCYVTVSSGRIYKRSQEAANGGGLISSVANRVGSLFGSGGGTEFAETYQSGGPIEQFGGSEIYGERGLADGGMHWVGDIIAQADIETDADCKQLRLELVEAGVRFQCRIDLTDGKATLEILDGDRQLPFVGEDKQSDAISAQTPARAGTSFSVRFSNCDDQLLLWIDDELVAFEGPNTFDTRSFRGAAENYPRYQPGEHPLDAAPMGIAVRGGTAKVTRVRIDRDKYYVATTNSALGIYDYDLSQLISYASRNSPFEDIQEVLATPQRWEDFAGWQARRKVSFELDEDQFFPMGDNSPESLDARCWAGAKIRGRLPDRFHDQAYEFANASYVPRDLLVGKALLVFWPHPWRTPLPITPNLSRIRLIR